MPPATPREPAWLVLPTYNEAENIEAFVAAPSARTAGLGAGPVVDDGSPDGTGEIADRLSPPIRDRGPAPAPQGGPRPGLHRGLPPRTGQGASCSSRWTRTFRTIPPTYRPAGGEEEPTWRSARATSPVVGLPIGVLCGERSAGRQRLLEVVLGLDVCDLTAGFKCFRREVLEGSTSTRSVAGLRLPGGDHLPDRPAGLQSGRGADRLPRPAPRQIKDRPFDRFRGDLAGATDALRAGLTRPGLAGLLAAVVAAAEVVLEEDVEHDEEVAAAHLLERELRVARACGCVQEIGTIA